MVVGYEQQIILMIAIKSNEVNKQTMIELKEAFWI